VANVLRSDPPAVPNVQREVTPVWLRRTAYAAMTIEADDKAPNETGGVLIGYERESAIVIVECVGPGPKAIHEPNRFVPDYDFQEREIARIYEQSGRIHTYLGDWHTHPAGSLRLSAVDCSTLRRIARHRAARLRTPLMIIAGPPDWRLSAWCWTPGALSILSNPNRCLLEYFE
jgi:integrative and conjugative element protein (TIGR02256 family)